MAQLALFVQNFFTRPLRSDRGATAVEYGLMVFFIAVVIIAAITLLGTQLSTLFNTVAGDI